MGQKNLLLNIIESSNNGTHSKIQILLAGVTHLEGKKNGLLVAALLAQIKVDYAEHILEDDAGEIICIFMTNAKAAFRSASRKHCYKLLR